MLEIRSVTKIYPGESLGAVADVSFKLNSGEIISIIGKSGSGKTTLLRMIAGLMKPDSGEIKYNDQPFLDPDEQLIAGHEDIRMVFQDYDLMPNLTVRENVEYKLLVFDADYKEQKTSELLGLCGLAKFENKLPKELSGGQQQRLSLARALAEEPEVLLMDEPFSSVDPITKQKLLLEVLKISKELGVALIFVTHDTKDALMISDRIGYMDAGMLIQIDKPEVLYENPLSIEVLHFLGLINEFSSADTLGSKLGAFPEGKSKMAIRADFLKLVEKGEIEVLVQDCRYLGTKYLIKTETKEGTLLFHKALEPWPIGEKAYLHVDQSEIMYFT